jgi:hypothetical protein
MLLVLSDQYVLQLMPSGCMIENISSMLQCMQH